MLLDCVYILEHHPNLFLANFWALNCVGDFTGLNLFEPELETWTYGPVQGSDICLNWTIGPVPGSQKSSKNRTKPDFGNTSNTRKEK